MFDEPQDLSVKRSGWIEVVTGSMFSGKTEELMRRMRRAKFAKKVVRVYKPLVDRATAGIVLCLMILINWHAGRWRQFRNFCVCLMEMDAAST